MRKEIRAKRAEREASEAHFAVNTDLHVMYPTTPAVIGWFDDFDGPNPYAALSNFYVGEPLTVVGFEPYQFQTGEHLFAAYKATNPQDLQMIASARDPQTAKTHGRNIRLRPDWESVKYDAMMAVLRTKFTVDRLEGRVLLSTEDALLIEGTYWDDTVWGVSLNSRGPLESHGRNWLGTMLMARRAELKVESQFGLVNDNVGRANALFAVRKQN